MKQHSVKKTPKRQSTQRTEPITIGIDIGDKTSRICILDAAGRRIEESSVVTTSQAMTAKFSRLPLSRVALEVGTHSPWLSRLLAGLGHQAIVANARQVKLITQSSRKDDRMDAELLARLARVDPQLLRPIRHRSEQSQQHMMAIRVRAALVEARSRLINTARGLAKAMGERLPKASAESMNGKRMEQLPEALQQMLAPLLEQVESLTRQIRHSDRLLEQIAEQHYPETKLLRQISGVGPLIALTFVLTVEDPHRFAQSRDAGCYVGLGPKRRQSGDKQAQLGISKEGNRYLRKLLVQGAHCILGFRGPDTDLKRWGRKLAERGGKNAKKRAVVAVARKLAVLLHRLWVTGEVYEPLRNSSRLAPAA